ncbi:GATA transcription factor 20-like [Triticum urartu]|uniref:GATA transcription factor 20-like n=1 Tax=Triticum urartu TaxID=4572 RepID=UPI0020448FD0|nr:GATA transcription factor 20-like [Triticum urartu]
MAQYNGKQYRPRRGPEHPLQPAEDPEAHAVINHLAVMAAEAEVKAMNAYREEHEQEVEEGEGDGQHGHGEHGGKVEVVQMDADAVVAAAAMAAAVVAATQLDLHRAMVSTIGSHPFM